MKKSHLFLQTLLGSLLLLSCQKEVSFEISSQTGGNGTTNDSRDSYSPTTKGSWWKYKDSTSARTSTTTIVSGNKTVNGIVYTAMAGDDGTRKDTAWIASPRPDYYLYTKGISPNLGASYDFIFHYLNDTASIGHNWRYIAGQGNGFTAYIQTTIVERNINMSVSGKSFSNVMHTRMILSYDVLGTPLDLMIYDYFVAKGVGIIKLRSEGQNLGYEFKACSDLIEYSIK